MDIDAYIAYLREYSKRENVLVLNPKRETEFLNAYKALESLLEKESINATIGCEKGQLINGYAVITVVADWIIVREIDKFYDAVKNADNFEVFPIVGDKVQMNAIFHGVTTVV